MLSSTSRSIRTALVTAACLGALSSTPTRAQSLNLRLTDSKPVPSSGYGAATGQAGVWNAVKHTTLGGGTSTPLVGLSGAATTAVGSITGCDTYVCTVSGYGPDVDALLGAFVNGDCYADPTEILVSGLLPGYYVMTGYGTTCYPYPHSVYVTLSDGSFSAQTTVAGSYNGSFAQMTLAVCSFEVQSGVTLRVNPNGFGAMSALQLAYFAPPVSYCTSKTNSQGCQALIGASGGVVASLSASTPFLVVASGVVTDTPGLFFFGYGRDIKLFKGGYHCVQAPTPRTPAQLSGNQGAPCGGSFSIDFNAFLQGSGASSVQLGEILDGQYWYRDPNDPLGFDSATSDAIEFAVLP